MSSGFPSGFAAGNVVRVERIGKPGGVSLVGCFVVWMAGKRLGDWVGGQVGGMYGETDLFSPIFFTPPQFLSLFPPLTKDSYAIHPLGIGRRTA